MLKDINGAVHRFYKLAFIKKSVAEFKTTLLPLVKSNWPEHSMNRTYLNITELDISYDVSTFSALIATS